MRHSPAIETGLPSSFVGAREAEHILGIRRTTLHRLIYNKELPARLIDRPGLPRYWRIRRTDVLRLKARGVLRRRPPLKKIRVAWIRAFGAIPEGLTVVPRDGITCNHELDNLILAPLPSLLRRAQTREQRVIRSGRLRREWTRRMLSILKREFPIRSNKDLANELNMGVSTLARAARKLGLRKNSEYLRERPASNRLPIGTERVHDRVSNVVQLKVSDVGKFHGEQWRPKHHVIWERANKHSFLPACE